VTLFTEPREQARAIGIYSFVAAAGASIGLLAGGFLTDALNWHWIFLVNIPIGIITAVLALRLLEADRGIGLGKGADALGAVLVLIFAALFGMFFLGSLFFQRVRGYDPLGIGLAFLPFSLSIAILSFASGPLITRFGARSVLLPSLALMGVGLLYFSRVPVDA